MIPQGGGSSPWLQAGAGPAAKVITKVITLLIPVPQRNDLICGHILCPLVPEGTWSWGGGRVRDLGVFGARLTLAFTRVPQVCILSRLYWPFQGGRGQRRSSPSLVSKAAESAVV